MKFLVDHQLPAALARFIRARGHEAEHVRDIGLQEADDTTIWQHVVARGLVVVSKDEDFASFSTMPGTGAKLVWLRIGNCRKKVLLEAFGARLPAIVSMLEAGNTLVELR